MEGSTRNQEESLDIIVRGAIEEQTAFWTDSSKDRTSASGADDTGSSPVPFTMLKRY